MTKHTGSSLALLSSPPVLITESADEFARAEFRGGFGRQLRASAERIIDGKVLALDDASKKPRPASAA